MALTLSPRKYFKGKFCLITGGTRGLGAATAREFAKRGAHLALVGRYLDDEANALRSEIEGMGARCVLIQGDMARPEDAKRCVEETTKGAPDD